MKKKATQATHPVIHEHQVHARMITLGKNGKDLVASFEGELWRLQRLPTGSISTGITLFQTVEKENGIIK